MVQQITCGNPGTKKARPMNEDKNEANDFKSFRLPLTRLLLFVSDQYNSFSKTKKYETHKIDGNRRTGCWSGGCRGRPCRPSARTPRTPKHCCACGRSRSLRTPKTTTQKSSERVLGSRVVRAAAIAPSPIPHPPPTWFLTIFQRGCLQCWTEIYGGSRSRPAVDR